MDFDLRSCIPTQHFASPRIQDDFMHSSHSIFDCDFSLSFDPSDPKDHPQFSQHADLEEQSSTLTASADCELSPEKSAESGRELGERGKGRRRKTATEESLMAERKRRMERNKVFAREHRLRQKQHIANLEKKVMAVGRVDTLLGDTASCSQYEDIVLRTEKI